MWVAREVEALRAARAPWARDGERVALVPTMGYLHAGHLSLVALARAHADRVVASVFVNPIQFAAGEDLETYPRDEARDLELLAAAGVDGVFLPTPAVMYPPDHQTRVTVGAVALPLCGAHRPSHFEGVATVCMQLFQLVQPQVAVFGEKDWQQLCVVRRMVRDLCLPLEILGGPLVREPDGLAMSSRNARLSAEARRRAQSIPEAIAWAQGQVRAGATRADALKAGVWRRLEDAGGRVDYVAVVDETRLTPLEYAGRPGARLALAAHFGGVRLIDNAALA